jgi:hypothetical protein
MSVAQAEVLSSLSPMPQAPVVKSPSWVHWLLGALALLILANLPAFLCMGLDPDALQWDLNTRVVLNGGALYRDAAENNLPGMLLPLVFVRSLFGWSSEVLRIADLLVVLVLTWQLVNCLPRRTSGSQQLLLGGTLLAFYLSTSEWCHCQRDVWMMAPALAALSLRRRQVKRMRSLDSSLVAIAAAAGIEGFVWALAFWIKPFVAVPALFCWLVSARLTWRTPGDVWKVLLDGGTLILAGLATGAAGIAWLVASGAWPAFLEVMLVWNREYVGYDVTEGKGWLCLAGLLIRLFPWVLVHLIAIPLTVREIWCTTTRPDRAPLSVSIPDNLNQPLLAAFYLGWLFQSVSLQHPYDYIQVPPILLGLTVTACWLATCSEPLIRRLAVACLVIGLVVRFPSLSLERIRVIGDCLNEGSTPRMRDRLTLLPKGSWSDLDKVKGFLQEQEVKDGELSCMNMATISLYGDLGVKPATRFHFIQSIIQILRSQQSSIFQELTASNQRFMVCDLDGLGMEKLRAELAINAPQSSRVAFRSGRYVVLRLTAKETPDWLQAVLAP